MGNRRRGVAGFVALVAALGAASACAPLKGPSGNPRVMLVGDSIPYQMAPVFGAKFASSGAAMDNATQSGCGVVRGVISDFEGNTYPWSFTCNDAAGAIHEDHLNRFRPHIVLWLGIVETFARYLPEGGWYAPGPWPLPSPNALGYQGGISGTAADLKLFQLIEEKRGQFEAKGARIVFLTMPPPLATFDHRDQRTAHLNSLLKQYVNAHPQAKLIDFASMACPPAGQPPCPAFVDGIQLRPDGFHFSAGGAAWAADLLVPKVIAS
ncbi:MAG: SGNH hydrolase domain-containing protein [Actinomycetota bacterium]